MSIDLAIREFAGFLSASWKSLLEFRKLVRDPDNLKDEWLQANWEVLVESTLGTMQFLQPYAGGADCYPDSSRVFEPRAMPTHVVACFPAEASRVGRLYDVLMESDVMVPETGLPFEKLVARAGAWFDEAPPFDHVLVEANASIYLFRLSEIRFVLREIFPDEI